MFEARLEEAKLMKMILEATKELVTEANFDCTSTGIALQAMDSSHVSLVGLLLKADGFQQYRCDRSLSLGINLASMAKILKCASNDDTLTIKAEEDKDTISFMFETASGGKVSDFELKLMDIETEALGIPDTEYKAVVDMSAAELQRICRDLAVLGDTAAISVTKGGVKFSVSGELGSGNVMCRNAEGAVDEEEKDQVTVTCTEAVTQSFALRYLNMFTKATPLSDRVRLSLSDNVPLVVEYRFTDVGYVRFYLAPKLDDANEGDEE